MTITRARFESGLTYAQWLEAMTQNKERFLANYEAAQINPQDVAAFNRLPQPLNVLVLAEDWCGDVIANLPILAKLASASGKLNLRIFKRDENLDIMDQYLNQGQFRSIPTIVFFDQAMNEVGRWHERPQMARDEMSEARRRFAAEHPDLADASKPVPEMSDGTRKLYLDVFARLRAENAARWTQAVVEEIRGVVRL
jgi:hypothetical protein